MSVSGFDVSLQYYSGAEHLYRTFSLFQLFSVMSVGGFDYSYCCGSRLLYISFFFFQIRRRFNIVRTVKKWSTRRQL